MHITVEAERVWLMVLIQLAQNRTEFLRVAF